LGNTIALPLFILVLFLALPAVNIERDAWVGNPSFLKGDSADCITEKDINDNNSREINYNNSGEVYRDGVIDNFKYFKIIGYPAENSENQILF